VTLPERDFAKAAWRKSTYSGYNGACIEIADLASGQIGVRDSKDSGTRDVLVFDRPEWAEFVSAIKRSSREMRA
jgi:hypothetical protein